MADIATVALIVTAIGGGLFGWTKAGEAKIESQHPPVGQFVEVNGQRLHYVDRAAEQSQVANAPALILVHGANGNLLDFESSIAPLLAQNHRVISFDRPGFGYSERANGAWQSPEVLAGLFLEAARKLGVQRPVIVGHSWAGSVVMAAAVKHAPQISGGVLLGGATGHWAGSVGATYDWGKRPVIGKVMAYGLVYPYGRKVLPEAVASVLAPNPVPEAYIDSTGAALALRPATFQHNIEDMTRLSEYLQVLSREYDELQVPLLAIHGDEDVLVPFWNHGQRLAWAYPALQIRLLPGVGHVPHHAQPVAVAAEISAFATRLGEAR